MPANAGITMHESPAGVFGILKCMPSGNGAGNLLTITQPVRRWSFSGLFIVKILALWPERGYNLHNCFVSSQLQTKIH